MPTVPETTQGSPDHRSAGTADRASRRCHGKHAPPGIRNEAVLRDSSRVRRPQAPVQLSHDHVVPHSSADTFLSMEFSGTRRRTTRGLVDSVASRTRPPVERRAVPLRGSVCDSRGPSHRSVDAQTQAAVHTSPPAGAADTCRPGRSHPCGGLSVGGAWRRTRASRARGSRFTRTSPATVAAAATSAGGAPWAMATCAAPVVAGVPGERAHSLGAGRCGSGLAG